MIGLTLFLAGASLGAGQYSWNDSRTLSTLIIGIVGLIAFGVYEWKGTPSGILHHDLLHGGKDKAWTFIICVVLIMVEGLTIFAFSLFYPILYVSHFARTYSPFVIRHANLMYRSQILFTTDPIHVVLRSEAAWIPGLVSTIPWGYASTYFRTVREPLLLGFVFITIGYIGLATLQPGQSTKAIAFACVTGVGFGAPLVLTVSGAQLVVPHKFLATASAVTTTARAVSVAVFTAIFSAVFNTRIRNKLPIYIAAAATASGLPASSLPAFIKALSTGQTATLAKIPGVTPGIIAKSITALEQAYADSIRVVFIIAAAFAFVSCFACLLLGDLQKTMNYSVDAPIEELHAKRHRHTTAERSS